MRVSYSCAILGVCSAVVAGPQTGAPVTVHLHSSETCRSCRNPIPAGTRAHQDYRGSFHASKAACRRAARSATPAVQSPDDLPATERQIAYALDLLLGAGASVHATLNYPVPSTEAVCQMDRAEISTLITDLTTEL